MGRAKDRLGRTGQRLRTLPDEGVQYGLKTVREAVLVALKQDAGTDRKLSGIRNGVPLGVKVTSRKTGQLVTGRIMATPPQQRAPWFWLNEGTKAGRRGARVGRYNSARANRGDHPGTPAKRTWSRAVPPALESVRRNFEELHRKALRG